MPKRARDIGRKHRPSGKTPEEIRAQSAMNARINGRKGGRPIGSHDVFPRHLITALKNSKLRIKAEYAGDETLVALAHAGLATYVRAMNGQIRAKKAPSAIKAALAVRQELCDPVITESKVNLNASIATAVAEAARRVDPMTLPPRDRSRDAEMTRLALAAPATVIPVGITGEVYEERQGPVTPDPEDQLP
jgi:hypothetical protein